MGVEQHLVSLQQIPSATPAAAVIATARFEAETSCAADFSTIMDLSMCVHRCGHNSK
jgi:hypothetical protein